MASSEVYETIFGAVQAAVTPTAVRRWEEIDQETEQLDMPFLAIEDGDAQEELVSIGMPAFACLRETGSIAVHVFVPAATSLKVGREIADVLRYGLSNRQLHGVYGHFIQVAAGQPPLPVLYDLGRWSAVIVSLPYTMDSVR